MNRGWPFPCPSLSSYVIVDDLMKPILRLPARPADGSVIRAEGRIVRHGMGGSDDPIIDDSECTGAAFNAALPVSALSFAFRANFETFLFREECEFAGNFPLDRKNKPTSLTREHVPRT